MKSCEKLILNVFAVYGVSVILDSAPAQQAATASKGSRRPLPLAARVVVWALGVPALLLLAVYVKLWFGPLGLPFIANYAEAAVVDALPENSGIELGEVSLSLDGPFRPVLQITPVTFTDHGTGARVSMRSLNLGFSPVLALIGRPGATVTLIEPNLQVIQDLFGPRLAGFDLVENPETGITTVRIVEGPESFPSVGIRSEGLVVRGKLPQGGDGVGLRSDNDWLIYNIDASEKGIADLINHAEQDRFSRLEVRNGTLQMHDSVYGLFRQFTDIDLRVLPGTRGQATEGTFSAVLAERLITGSFSRQVNSAGAPRLMASVSNLDFAAVVPFIDDPDGMMAIRGGGSISADLTFDRPGGTVTSGVFDTDLSGTSLRIREDMFPINSADVRIKWAPEKAEFRLDPAQLAIGQSSGEMEGVFVLGLDDVFGPTVSMSVRARSVVLAPFDLPPPVDAFTQVDFTGWSAPLYGAVGIDKMVARKPGVEVRATGRLDMLSTGLGAELEVGGEGASADDLKRLWPYFLSQDNRDWFVQHVTDGRIASSSMRFNFPIGSLSEGGERRPIPPGAMTIDMTATGVAFKPMPEMDPVPITGETSLQMRDGNLSIAMAGASIPTEDGEIAVSDAAILIDFAQPSQSVIEISGDVNTGVPALVAFVKMQAGEALEANGLPLDLASLSGDVSAALVATIVYDEAGQATFDYAANGSLTGFASREPIADRKISDGQLNFSASPAGYKIGGNATLDGMVAEVEVEGTFDTSPEMRVSSVIDTRDFAKFGFDVSEFGAGKVRFVAKPMEDGTMQIAVDITDTSIDIKDLGLSKARGVPGTLSAAVRQDGTRTDVTQITLNFSDVRLAGSVAYDSEAGLISADFPEFALSRGDNAQVSATPISGGYAVRVRGEQLDLKPMLKRFFALDQVSTGGPQATAVNQTLALDVELKRAVGFYRVTAYNLDTTLRLRGEELSNVSLQAQFTEGNSVSITTNPAERGRVMSVAFNDLGTILRFLNVYPRVLGGSGSMTLAHNTQDRSDTGDFRISDFSLVDEEKVAQILGNHQDSRALIARENRVNFRSGRARFVRRSDRIEVTEGVLDGNTVGGTMRGFVYTKSRQYDLTGTYVPLFGLNNAFQRLPIIGQLIGGREGEGLVGVTFAVRGSLDDPQFLVNPASLLVPGAFRALFEFRAKEAPREQ